MSSPIRFACGALLLLLLTACGGQNASPSESPPSGGVGGDPAIGAGSAAAGRQTLKAGDPPRQPAPDTALLPDAAPRAAQPLSTAPLGEARRIMIGFRESVVSTSAAPAFLTIDLDGLSRRAGIHVPAVVCVIPAGCTPAAERLNLAWISAQPDIGGAVLEVAEEAGFAVSFILGLLQADPAIARAELDRRVSPTFRPNDPEFAAQWALQDTRNDPLAVGRAGSARFETAWDRLASGIVRKATVAVIDTGLVSHPDVAGPDILPGTDLIGDRVVANDGDGRDDDPADPGDGGVCGGVSRSSSWHGTHVTGTIAAIANNGYGVTGAGLDAVRIVPVRVLGRCGGYLSDAADGILWAVGGALTADGVAIRSNAHRADVINLSLGASGACPEFLQKAIDFATARGAVVVVAAGNESADVSNATPANCARVVAVGANDRQGRLASFSNTGAGVTLLAPGVGIRSTVDAGTTSPTGPTLADYDGTSMAAPHVAAAAALLKALDPTLTPEEVTARLKRTAAPFVQVGSGCSAATCGAGYLDAAALVATIPVPAGATPSPAAPTPVSEAVEAVAPRPSAGSPAAGEAPVTEPPAAVAEPAPVGSTPPAAATPAGRGGGGSLGPFELVLLLAALAVAARVRPAGGTRPRPMPGRSCGSA